MPAAPAAGTGSPSTAASWCPIPPCAGRGLTAVWPFTDGSELRPLLNFGDMEIVGCPPPPAGRLLFTTSDDAFVAVRRAVLPPWSVL